jgi:hypothetical protein
MSYLIIFSLIIGNLFAFHPTIDGARQILPYIETDLPYLLGISVPPPAVGDPLEYVDLLVIQGDDTLWQGLAVGTFTIQEITNPLPVYIYSDNLLQYTIVPEPCTLLLVLTGFLIIRR